ncbi:MAG: hypothetical protein KKE02_20710 [Alphaproteobacteria bacterium]|nr:hypothetical protein [Alphaproteobacteria bacterium]MBU1514543.1 hypothetical protein [Alphaproteobacteria bacterium]MBU2096825.1 hypothetical protein [Alphaproteobacteria bacterium]MBU2153452.1 hypothetical protein [Alphaproteobacteria bacterium]MBU2306043.1 hypothetical protein [Alphaproteobacteria bacterium]
MNIYVFQLGVGDAPATTSLRFVLASDLQASVRAFDLLRNHPDCDWAVAALDGEPILKRAREGEKQTICWLRPRPVVASTHKKRRLSHHDRPAPGRPGSYARS